VDRLPGRTGRPGPRRGQAGAEGKARARRQDHQGDPGEGDRDRRDGRHRTIDGGHDDHPRVPALHRDHGGGRAQLPGLATAAFAPEEIKATQVEPADFDAFWAAGKAELGKDPARRADDPDARRLHLDGRRLPRELPHDRQGPGAGPDLRNPLRAARERPLPGGPQGPGCGRTALLRRPRAGRKGRDRARDRHPRNPGEHAKEVYDVLGAGALNGYWLFNFDDRDLLLPARLPELHPVERLPDVAPELGRQA
jgi:hypothetical protein